MKKRQLYTWGAEALIAAELPKVLKDAMSITGWNAFGIYELVKAAIGKDDCRSARELKEREAKLTSGPSGPSG